jgi:hypothetical protein
MLSRNLQEVIDLKPLLPFIISDTQKGFIKGRFIGENTRLLYDLMHYLEQHNKTGLLLLDNNTMNVLVGLQF